MKIERFFESPVCRHGLGASLAVCLLLALASFGQCAVVNGVRYSSSAERTRIVLDVDGLAGYSHRTLSNPARILIVLEGSSFAKGVIPVRLDDGTVRRIRLNSLSSGRIQIVLDLDRMSEYTTFTLSGPPRLVVDVVTRKGPPGQPFQPAMPVASDEKIVQSAQPPEDDGLWMIAIDAGHGGEDPGCQYHGLREKEIVLALGRELQLALNKKHGFEAFMVRKGDYLIPLTTRRRIAEKQSADLFISVHCNASDNSEANGTEVFFLSLKGASDQAAHELAQRENAVDEMLGLDLPEGDLEEIMLDMMQADIMVKSEMLAEAALDALVDLGTVLNRGVKQAGFVVLKSPRIPSIMVEAGFLSNREESRLLADKGWQKEFGRLLAVGIENYCLNTQTASVPVVR